MAAPSYPHVIKAKGRDVAGHVTLCVVLFAIGVWMTIVLLLLDGDAGTRLALLALVVAVGGFAGWEAVDAATSQTVFEASAVTARSAWGKRRFERAALAGWRFGGERAGLRFVELYAEGAKRPFIVMISKAPDDVVAAWFEGAEDLALRDRIKALDAIEADESFGHTAQERVQNAGSEGRIVAFIGLALMALAGWPLLFPVPYKWAVGAAIVAPVIVLLATFVRRDRWSVGRTEGDFRPETGGVIVVFAFVLSMRAILDWRLLSWTQALLLAAGFAVVATGLLSLVFGERNRERLVGWFIVALMYGYGALIPLNMWLDRANPEVYRAQVEQLGGDRFRLHAPAPFPATIEADASPEYIRRLVEQGEACLSLYGGAFGVRSYDIAVCERGGAVRGRRLGCDWRSLSARHSDMKVRGRGAAHS